MLSSVNGSSSFLDRPLSLEKSDQSKDSDSSFAATLQNALNKLNDLQLEADGAARALALGEIDDLHSVTIAGARADLALQLTIQIRNRVVDAYQEIIRMQV